MITEEVSRAQLAVYVRALGLVHSQIEQIATMLRDALIAQRCDPSSEDDVRGAFVGTMLCLSHLSNTPPIPNPQGIRQIVMQAECLRAMLDGEIPRMTMADMLGLGGLPTAPPPNHLENGL